ncbi:MAG: HEAT repeat domain-containing protein [Armatimonadota bacterium]|nr:HEAT repeat domain-containing protein [Armatimonadota bacterium]MDR7548646.1 HEAT repeat domain-containing protein [Armatimonadota bacterium]
MEPKAQAAERVLRGLGVAVKTFALYPPSHPVITRAIEKLIAALRAYGDAYGPFAVRVTKHALIVDGLPFKTGPQANLAFYLFTRKITYFKIMPAVSDQALTAFASALSMDRAGLEAAGGVRTLLRQAGAGNIQVAELAPQDEEEDLDLDLAGILEMLRRGRPAPQERERVIEILRAGPEQTKALLEGIASMSGDLSGTLADEGGVEQLYLAMRNLDRMMLDEPFEEQARLYANVAGAHLMVREPVRLALVRALVQHAAGDGAVRLLGQHLSTEQLAQVIHESVGGKDVEKQVTMFLRALCADSQKARAVLTMLDTRLRPPDRGPNWLTDRVWPQLQPQPRATALPPEFEFDGAAPGADLAGLAPGFAADVDEPSVMREVSTTLVDILRDADEKHRKEIADVADALMAHLTWLADQREYPLLASLLAGLKEIAASETGILRTTAADILRKTAEGPLVEGLLAALWASRDTPTERQIRAILAALADHLVAPMVRALGTESRGGARAMLCDLIVEFHQNRIDDLGKFVGDERWYLVRNIASILGRLRSARAVPYLSRLVDHPDYRVRRETVDALAAIGTEEAQATLGTFLDDPDERLRLRALESLDTWQAWQAMPRILAILERPDPFHRQFALKRAALEALARLGAKQSLPVVRKIARSWFLWGTRGRELRRLAAATASVIEGHASQPHRRHAAGGRHPGP